MQIWLKPDKNNVYFTWRPMYIYGNMSLDYSLNQMLREKCGRDDVEEYDSIRQAKDDNKMRRRKYARIQTPSQ